MVENVDPVGEIINGICTSTAWNGKNRSLRCRNMLRYMLVFVDIVLKCKGLDPRKKNYLVSTNTNILDNNAELM